MSTPIVKWAGGKRKLVDRIVALAPQDFGTYHEPFVGGGAVFFGLCRAGRIRHAVLNDLNEDLVNTYREVRDEPSALLQELASLADAYLGYAQEGRGEVYYKIRAAKPLHSTARAAWLLFLNRTCYNGLYRVNRSGEFNVPHGDYANPRILDRDGILAAAACLQSAELLSEDFGDVCRRARTGDFVYLDPPYHPLSATANFTSYTSEDFGDAEQVRLRDEFEALTVNGTASILSNARHPRILSLYENSGFTLEDVLMPRAINSAGDGRTPIRELLISNFDRPEVRRAHPARDS